MPDAAGLLREGIARLEIPDPGTVGSTLERYLEELRRWNPRFGFVNTDSPEELVVKHLLDSLAPWRIIREEAHGGRVFDVGSGAGLPGIPLAAALPDVSFTLLERSGRKVSFLRTCKVLLGLARTEVMQADLSSLDAACDVATFRAVAPLSRFLEDAGRGGFSARCVAAYKGRLDRARQEIDDVRRFTAGRWEAQLVPLTVPFLDEERCIALLRFSSLLTNH